MGCHETKRLEHKKRLKVVMENCNLPTFTVISLNDVPICGLSYNTSEMAGRLRDARPQDAASSCMGWFRRQSPGDFASTSMQGVKI